MDFSSDADFEDLLEVNPRICMPQMAKKASPDAPPNYAVVPWALQGHSAGNTHTH